ncbi:MAG: hypothetical protein AB7T22_10940 [Calditrichaceae bacterium]
MDRLKLMLLCVFFFAAALFAQNPNDLNLQLSRHSNISGEWDLLIDLNLDQQIDSALIFEFPQWITAVPSSVQLNDKTLWLQNSEDSPESDSVVTWQIGSDGLGMHFKDGLIKAGDRVNVKCLLNVKKIQNGSRQVSVKKMAKQGESFVPADEVMTSAAFPNFPENNN